MLPFCLGMPEKAKVRDAIADYYEGLRIALTEMELYGLRMDLKVYDTKQDSAEVIKLLSNPDMQKLDLIIGPVFDNELVEVEKFCAIYNIPLVSPIRYKSNTFGTDFPLINCNTVDSLEYFYLGKQVAEKFKKYQIIIVEEMAAGKPHSSFARNFKRGFEISAGKTIQIIDGKTKTPEQIRDGSDSVLLFFTGQGLNGATQAGKLKKAANGLAQVMAPADWLNSPTVDYNALNGVYFYDPYYINNSDTGYQALRKVYRERFGGDPNKYTVIGYEQFTFFSMALMAWGNDFYKHILNKSFPYMHRDFSFTVRGNLIENSSVNIMYLKDYKLFKAVWRN